MVTGWQEANVWRRGEWEGESGEKDGNRRL
jgi:hypothetical protein